MMDDINKYNPEEIQVAERMQAYLEKDVAL